MSLALPLVGIFGWIRFKQIRYVCGHIDEVNNNERQLNDNQCQRILKWNKYGLYMFVVIMVSMIAISAFRSTEHLMLHILSANPMFTAYYIEVGIQTWISFQLVSTANTLRTARFRAMASATIYTMSVIFLLSCVISFFQLKVPLSQIQTNDRLWWDEKMGGYEAHVISAIAESLTIFMAGPYFASFVTEFSRIRTKKGRLEFIFLN